MMLQPRETAEGGPRVSATLRKDAPARAPFLAIGAVAAVAVAWQLITLHFVGGMRYWSTTPEAQLHLVLNWLCMALVIGHALRVRGHMDYKVAQSLIATALVFGVFALSILGGRLFFSRGLLVSTAAETLCLSLLLLWLLHRLRPTRVALIRPLLGEGPLKLRNATIVSDPSTDLRAFDVALVSLTETVSSEWARALARGMLAGCKIRHVGEYVEELRGAVSLDHFEIEHLPPDGITSYRPVKRFLDLAIVTFILPVVLPVALAAAALILITSGGPVLFVQQRVGLGGKPFKMWKLRTMRPEREGELLRAAVPNDSRVTSVGRLLRRFRIDELPQLWNVLKGDMSLIGPRPEALPLHAEYVANLPNYAYRYLVRPGITGWAQVSAPPSANVDQARLKLTFDLYYVKKLSLVLDLKIALRTLWTIATGGGVR